MRPPVSRSNLLRPHWHDPAREMIGGWRNKRLPQMKNPHTGAEGVQPSYSAVTDYSHRDPRPRISQGHAIGTPCGLCEPRCLPPLSTTRTAPHAPFPLPPPSALLTSAKLPGPLFMLSPASCLHLICRPPSVAVPVRPQLLDLLQDGCARQPSPLACVLTTVA